MYIIELHVSWGAEADVKEEKFYLMQCSDLIHFLTLSATYLPLDVCLLSYCVAASSTFVALHLYVCRLPSHPPHVCLLSHCVVATSTLVALHLYVCCCENIEALMCPLVPDSMSCVHPLCKVGFGLAPELASQSGWASELAQHVLSMRTVGSRHHC